MSSVLSCGNRSLTAQYAELGRGIEHRVPKHDAKAQFDTENWKAVSDAGLWRLAVPRDLGGLGASWADFAAALEGLAATAGDLGFLISTLGHIGSLRVVINEGNSRQKERWLEPLMRGDIGVTAMTEETGGSDLARLRLAATRSGTGWSLSGKKVHITNAPFAKHGMIAGRIPSLGCKRDITLFFLDMNLPGISTGPLENNLGIRTSPTADLYFKDVGITEDNILGRSGDGLRILHEIIAFERALYGVIASGLIEGMINKAMKWVEDRTSFNRPLADFQYVQGRVTDMKMAAIVCRLLTYSGLQELAQGNSNASIVCSTAKFHAGEQLLAAAEHLVQLHGHLGFMNNDLSRHLRDAVGMRIAGGTSDIQRINIFNQMRRQATASRLMMVGVE